MFMRLPSPKMTWYYDAFTKHEFRQTFLSYFDDLEESASIFLKNSKEQIDYFLIHQEYHYVKKRVLTSFIENERSTLNTHYEKRALNMQTTISNLENSNIKNRIASITQNSLDKVLNSLNDKSLRDDILEASFESALKGLKEGKMEYSGDKLLPMFLEELNKETSKLASLSPEEENKLFALTEDQRKQVISMDNRAKLDYLNHKPEVNASIKNSDVYTEIVNRMKTRVESTLKL